jgi:hypothetical protein
VPSPPRRISAGFIRTQLFLHQRTSLTQITELERKAVSADPEGVKPPYKKRIHDHSQP